MSNDHMFAECESICQAMEDIPRTHSSDDAEKEIASLLSKWESTRANTPLEDTHNELELRFRKALESAQQHASSKPADPSEIVFELEKLVQNPDAIGADKEYNKLVHKWETVIRSRIQIADELRTRYRETCEQYTKDREWVLWANLKKKEEICTQLAKLADGDDEINLVDRFNDQRSLWKETGPVPVNKIKEIGKKYRALCETIYEKCLVIYKAKEQEKEKNLRLKEALCEEIENLTEPSNWKQATEFVQKIQQNWDACGPVPKESSEVIWERFKKACATFFENRKKFYHDRKLFLRNNATAKKEICDTIDALKDSTDWKTTSQKIKELQKEWQKIGPAPRPQEETLWKRFRAACDQFFGAQKAFFDSLETERPNNLEKKTALCTALESLGDMPDDEKYAKILELQSEWKNIGPVPRESEKEIWKRFRKPIDDFFDKRKTKIEGEKSLREQNKALKEGLCAEAEALSGSSDWHETANAIKNLQKKWKDVGPTHREVENVLWKRFHAACESFFTRFKEHNAEERGSIDLKLQEKYDICFQAEIISGVDVSKREEEERAEWQLKKLTENFWFRVLDDDDKSWEAKAQKLKDLQKLWREIGPVPTDKDRILWKRFQRACNHFFEARKK